MIPSVVKKKKNMHIRVNKKNKIKCSVYVYNNIVHNVSQSIERIYDISDR